MSRKPQKSEEPRLFREAEARVPVLLPLALEGPLDYRTDTPPPRPGTFVRVPLTGREITGVVWEKGKGDQALPLSKLKPVLEILDVPALSEEQRRFVEWVASYTVSAPGMVLKMCMSAPGALKSLPTVTLYYRADNGFDPGKLTPERLKVLEALNDRTPRTVRKIAKLAKVSEAVVRGMVKQDMVEAIEKTRDAPYTLPDPMLPGPKLNAEQKTAAKELKAGLDEGFRVTVLEGVTGSGKTEVYFEAIAPVLKEGKKQVLVLLPEIALTSQWLERFHRRFGARPIEWHSDLGPAQRRRAWRAVASGEARVVVGARSALFLPFRQLGLIVVDEEHDPSFKQEEGVTYQGRDMAVVRARFAGCPVVLSSATPSYETLANIERGKYEHATLTRRYGGAAFPEISGIDMRESPPESGKWLSPALTGELNETLARGEQAMLFLNRRGYAPLTLCRKCGTRIECPNCTAWLVEHRLHRRLMCHHCGHSIAAPRECPECGAEDSLAACGPGVERLEEEAAKTFPEAKRVIMTSDTVTSPEKAAHIVARIAMGDADIIIGTQIITKGYHFPKLTLVGVVDADLGLKGGDLRAAERTYQQLEQVAGRAGREQLKGRVLIQTYMPDEPVMKALLSGDKQTFVGHDMGQRKAYGMPPFGRLAAVLVSGNSHARVEETARALARAFPKTAAVKLFGPAQAPLARLKGRHRYRLLLKSDRATNLQGVIRNWLAGFKTPGGVRLKVDIDPYSFL